MRRRRPGSKAERRYSCVLVMVLWVLNGVSREEKGGPLSSMVPEKSSQIVRRSLARKLLYAFD